MHFNKKDINYIINASEIPNDFVYSPLNKLICFNLLLISKIEFEEIEKWRIQILIFPNIILINNSKGCSKIFEIFSSKFHFKEVSYCKFIDSFPLNYHKKEVKFFNRKKNISFSDFNFSNYFVNSNKCHRTKSKLGNSIKIVKIPDYKINEQRNFFPNYLLYWIISLSIDKLTESSKWIGIESNCMNNLSISLSENERSDFFRRLLLNQNIIQSLKMENFNKYKFLEYFEQKTYFFDKLCKNDLNNSFKFLSDILFAKVKKVEYMLNKSQKIIDMARQNFSIISKYNSEQMKNKLKLISKVISIFTFLFLPITAFTSLLSVNFKITINECNDSYIPIFSILAFCFILIALHLICLFRMKLL